MVWREPLAGGVVLHLRGFYRRSRDADRRRHPLARQQHHHIGIDDAELAGCGPQKTPDGNDSQRGVEHALVAGFQPVFDMRLGAHLVPMVGRVIGQSGRDLSARQDARAAR